MNRSNPKIIGAFVIGAMALAVVAVAVVGSGHLFHKSFKYVLCFPGDLSGLRVGRPRQVQGRSDWLRHGDSFEHRLHAFVTDQVVGRFQDSGNHRN